MYLARKNIKGVPHYSIRQSYRDGDHFLSRELVDLGTHPAEYIIYPGGNAFYIDPMIEVQLDQLGVIPHINDLEDIFWQFLDPTIQRALEYFRHREKNVRKGNLTKEKSQKTQPGVHTFDKRRLHYLKFGRMEQGYLWLIPDKVFNILHHKSRDEIEQQFLEMEQQLNPREYKAYAYVIFNINQFFTESFSKKRPQYLKQSDVDGYFIDEICKLNQDRAFWTGMPNKSSLHDYLIRYILMYFDYDYAPRSWVEDYIRHFINSHHDYQMPFNEGSVTMDKASSIFGESKAALKKMNRKELVRLFRHRALELHPDKGGDHEKFVELTQAYHVLLKSKK